MKKIGLTDSAIRRIKRAQESFGEEPSLPVGQNLDKPEGNELIPETRQEEGFKVGDETPIGVIRDITQRGGETIYFVGGNENGAFAQLMTRKDLEREIMREKQRQEKQREIEENQKAEEAKNDLQGFTDNMSPRQKGQVEKFLLNVSIKYKGEEYRPKEFVETLLEQGYSPSTVLGKPAASLPDGTYVNLQKTSYDYMVYLSNFS